MSDDEMREAIKPFLHVSRPPSQITDDDAADAILAKLRELGAWLPGSEVSDEMVRAGESALLDAYRSKKATTSGLVAREVVTAALNAIPRSGT